MFTRSNYSASCRGLFAGIVLTVGALAGPSLLAQGAGPASAQSPALAMLDRLEAGQWDLRERGADGDKARICVGTGRQLIQIRHLREACKSFVIEDTAQSVTVHYTCPGNGFGRTRIRFENPQLVQIETQGIAKGLPFDFTAEGRRSGACVR